MHFRPGKVAPLLFFSGACALVYQIAWVRELRLIFGASTAASAAVLAVFMAGLGAGSLLLSKRAERADNPLRFYARLELGIGVSAAVTPALVWLSRVVYLKLGGESSLGATGSTVVRLLLSALVLALPTVLMGGTLPAAARAVETEQDLGRRKVAVLYGVNTLGAVLGAITSNFVFLEIFGTRLTLWLCCLVNLLVAMTARAVARGGENKAPAAEESAPPAAPPEPEALPSALYYFAPAAAGVAGFAFLLMELVWYRMLAPLLGGSSYTFGLILVVALLGIGVGSVSYSLLFGRSGATLKGFALTCALEALFVVVPYALGDRIALLTVLLRPLGALGFLGHVSAWSVITAIVVLPAAIVSGAQFPLLIGLFGRGDASVGRHVGIAYFANTIGAIAGSIAGGFGLIPLLTAPGCWRVVVILLVSLSAFALALAAKHERRGWTLAGAAAACVAALLLVRAEGPTAFWRHSPIGAGRADDMAREATINSLAGWERWQRAGVEWEADGRESSIALWKATGYAFIVNGKSDGDARGDAPTQVFGGLLGAMLHPNPKRALVIGLGTGSTTGWLARVPTMDRVDVVELEPAIVRVARACASVNEDALDNPKVHVTFADAREVLLTTKERYDVIFSEPSNPYRAGISSLYTIEYYEAAARALNADGIFVQWMQAYEIGLQAVHTVIATLRTAFPSVSIWENQPGDLLFVAQRDRGRLDVSALRRRATEEPYRRAMQRVWRAQGAEALLAHYIANQALADGIKGLGASINTDDLNTLEFAYARDVGRGAPEDGLSDQQLAKLAEKLGISRPATVGGPVDWERVEEEKWLYLLTHHVPVHPREDLGDVRGAFFNAISAYCAGSLEQAAVAWKRAARDPKNLAETGIAAEALASVGDDAALPLIERLRGDDPIAADVVLARLLERHGKLPEAAGAMARALVSYRRDPWPSPRLMERALGSAARLAKADPKLGAALYEATKEPFALRAIDVARQETALELARHLPDKSACVEALEPFEPSTPWNRSFLETRSECYRAAGHPLRARALEELTRYLRDSRSSASPPFPGEEGKKTSPAGPVP